MRIWMTVGLLLVGVVVSCRTARSPSTEQSPYIYPWSEFTSVETNSPTYFPALFKSRDDYEQWLFRAGGPDQLQIIQNDPFENTEHLTVWFTTTDTGEQIANYYESLFQRGEWHLEREHLVTEESGIVGTDWGRSYRKGSIHILVTVYGCWQRNHVLESEQPASRAIGLSFLGTTPADFLGENYKNNPTTGNQEYENTELAHDIEVSAMRSRCDEEGSLPRPREGHR